MNYFNTIVNNLAINIYVLSISALLENKITYKRQLDYNSLSITHLVHQLLAKRYIKENSKREEHNILNR